MLMDAEMAEQPALLARLVDGFAGDVAAVAGLVVEPPSAVVLVGRGSSDNAAVLGRYAIEMATGRPVALAAPSLTTRYGGLPDYRDVLVVALSQSGQTPEIASTVRALRAAGARVLVITNDERSPVAAAAQLVLPLGVGPERAVPATKTVTAQMLKLLAVAAALGPLPLSREALEQLPAAVAGVIADRAPATALAQRWSGADGLLVVARGLLLAAALETALKVRESAGVTAIGTSSADLLHGPIAAVQPGSAVLLVDGDPATAADLRDLGARLVALGVSAARMGTGGDDELALAPGLEPLLLPIVATVRGQQLAGALARVRGMDPDAPAGLSKVTRTK